eukprot:CAMPEP_0172539552 /NCGR_PEP_ID=MMETSP1067-20121228/10738_1 /TAXON_ID=265564 ORGANISM="Thalassiosira punctigera, Strain Tpunct2005C2" /NCGR_SAMPLE_ID=MMETSP1067 /ASSEMBLY_ACC=CAM_ASM_000444 /LENGTH=79 /DNA_ID=CAMNT_0013325253 /DNA_START=96 /DNA_END=335 /DNA_ORIENTATION=-
MKHLFSLQLRQRASTRQMTLTPLCNRPNDATITLRRSRAEDERDRPGACVGEMKARGFGLGRKASDSKRGGFRSNATPA